MGVHRMEDKTNRPSVVTDEHLEYLDELRLSGITNMLGATPYIIKEFDITHFEAETILFYWMKTFTDRYPDIYG